MRLQVTKIIKHMIRFAEINEVGLDDVNHFLNIAPYVLFMIVLEPSLTKRSNSSMVSLLSNSFLALYLTLGLAFLLFL